MATAISKRRSYPMLDSRSYKNMFPGLICGWKEISIVKNRNLIDSFTACALCCRMSGEKRLSYLIDFIVSVKFEATTIFCE